MSAPAPRADRLGTLSAASLALLSLAALDVLALPLLPTTAAGVLGVAVPWLAVLLVAVALPAEGPRSPALRALAILLAASPALLAASWLASGGSVGWRVPGLGLVLACAVTCVLSAAPLRVRRAVAVLLLALWGADTVLATARVRLLPAELNPVRTPLLDPAWLGEARPGARYLPPARGVRPGAPVPLLEGGGRASPWYQLAEEGLVPRGMPIVMLLGTPPEGLGERVTLPAPPGALGEPPREVAVLRASAPPRHPYDLGGVELVVLARDAWPAGGDAVLHAEAVARFARLGGDLVLLGEGRSLAGLDDALRGGAGRWTDEAPAMRRFGSGVLWRAEDLDALRAVLTRALAAPRLKTAFDLAQPPPAPPANLRPTLPRERVPLGVLLLAVALVVGLLEGGARSLRGLGASLALPLAASLAGVVVLAPRGGDLGVVGLTLDLGGAGGRRIEALWLEAGERGFAGVLEPGPSGLIRRVPGGNPLAVELAPGSGGWLVLEREAGAPAPGLREDRTAGWLRDLLVGEVPAERLRFMRGPLPQVRLAGVALPEVQALGVAGGE